MYVIKAPKKSLKANQAWRHYRLFQNTLCRILCYKRGGMRIKYCYSQVKKKNKQKEINKNPHCKMNKNLTQIDDETVKEIIQNGRGAEKDKHTLYM